MATTNPDDLFSPDSDNQYALTQDMGAMQTSVQRAFVRRANLYVGTAVQRNGFTSAAEGVHWQDTDGSRQEYVRRSGVWTLVIPDTGWVPLRAVAGFTLGDNAAARTIGSVTYLRGSASKNSGSFPTATSGDVIARLPSSAYRPIGYGRYFASAYGSGTANLVSLVMSNTSDDIVAFSAGAVANTAYFSGVTYPKD